MNNKRLGKKSDILKDIDRNESLSMIEPLSISETSVHLEYGQLRVV